ncbi:hypothetical protein, partial [Petrachloros mirabilis]
MSIGRSRGRLMRLGLMVPLFSLLAGCAKHADFVEIRDRLSTVAKSQDQDHQRMDAIQRRMESLEHTKDIEPSKSRYDELSARLQKLEARMAKLDEAVSAVAVV